MAGLIALAFGGAGADGAELKVASRPDMVSVLNQLAPQIEALIEAPLVIDAALGADSHRLNQPFDVAIVDGPTLTTLIERGQVADRGAACFAWTGLGLAVPIGAPKPDITTADGLRRTLLAARLIAFTGDQHSGAMFRNVLAQLGIESIVEKRLTDTGSANPLKIVARGSADVGIALHSEIVSFTGTQPAGLLPWEMRGLTPFFAAIARDTNEREAARRFIGFLGSFEAGRAFHTVGLETVVSE